METRKKFLLMLNISLIILLCVINVYALSNDGEEINLLTKAETEKIEKLINENMSKGKIPGLSITIVKDDKTVYQRGFGYSDIDEEKLVTSQSLFELASNSKAFTALAILSLEESGEINLNDKVTKYIPWLKVSYKGKEIPITIEQILHQTTGISPGTIDNIPISNDDNALEETVRTLIGVELDSEPGNIFQYATINYDILGLIVEKVTGNTYENYISETILKPLELNNTYLFRNEAINDRIASGYKMAFLKPRLYEAPIYRGNKPAGYIISSGEDMAKWLKIQMDTVNELDFDRNIIRKSHEAKSVADVRGTDVLYAGGWFLESKEQITHDGMNPNYSSFITFNNKDKIGIAVLANIGSVHVQNITQEINGVFHGKIVNDDIVDSNQFLDKLAMGIIFILSALILVISFFIIRVLMRIFRKEIYFEFSGIKDILKLTFSLLFIIGLSCFIYLIPKYLLYGMSWKTVFVWSPNSIKVALYSLYLTVWLTYIFVILKSYLKNTENI